MSLLKEEQLLCSCRPRGRDFCLNTGSAECYLGKATESSSPAISDEAEPTAGTTGWQLRAVNMAWVPCAGRRAGYPVVVTAGKAVIQKWREQPLKAAGWTQVIIPVLTSGRADLRAPLEQGCIHKLLIPASTC